jgi:hypothetical protein
MAMDLATATAVLSCLNPDIDGNDLRYLAGMLGRKTT